jgi:CBS domain-containing protein
MRVAEIMTPDVETIDTDASIHEAAAKMRLADIGCLPVSNGFRLEGLITDRDIIVRAVARSTDPAHTKVAELMTREIVYCFEDQTVDEAMHAMGEKQVRRLPVLSRDKRLIGIVSMRDLAVRVNDETRVARLLRQISEDLEAESASADARLDIGSRR